MGLNNCPDCGKPVSTQAIACPHCGRPKTAAPVTARTTQVRPSIRIAGQSVAGFIALLFFVYWISNGNSPQTPQNAGAATAPTARPPVYKTTAQQLVSAYDKNEVATNEAIGGAIVEVSGHIASIDMDAMDHAVIQMASGVDFEAVGLTLEDSQKGLAAKLAKGQALVVRCKTMARIIASPRGDDCVIVQ
jgi:putative nucleic acid binding protein/zinc ribbon protein